MKSQERWKKVVNTKITDEQIPIETIKEITTMTNLFNKLAFFTDIHYGMRNNARQHNEDCDPDWFIEQAKAKGCETCIFGGDCILLLV